MDAEPADAKDTPLEPPRLVGVVDIGANSVRLAVAQVRSSHDVEVLERAERPVRLGHDTFLRGRLTQRAMNAAIAVLRDYRKLLDTYGVNSVRAVATSAVREAANADAFVDRVAMAVDFDLEVLDPTEESRLTVSAVHDVVRDALDIERRLSLIVSVGGGSTLLTLLNDGVIVASESHSLGSVRFQETLATPQEPLERETELLRRQIANTAHMIAQSMPIKKVRSAVLVGEEAQVAARHAGSPVDESGHVYTLERRVFDKLVAKCSAAPPTALARRFGLPLPNAERLVPALLIHQALLTLTKAERAVVCDVSMADGLLLDMARRVCGEEDTEFDEAVIRSATSIGEKYRYDAEHAAHVAALALFLFDELQPEHRLTPRHRLLLRVAAILHEVGRFVNSRAHHKHSYYLVSNAEIFGLGRRDIEIAALVARYHRRAQPRRTHTEYMTLSREDRMAVSKLAAILRVADALERGHAQQVRDIRIERRPAELVITAPGISDLTLEHRALAQKADLFEDTFGMKVRVEGIPSGPDSPSARPVE
jgi:exopolyphosphatase/guanosine-5'-triphosphate,3'-diphosphate pyrophosphatase